MATVEQVTARYSNFLLPIPSLGDGICSTCRTSVLPGWRNCSQCNNHRSAVSETAHVVAPIALSVKGEQWAYELSAYKNSPRKSVRNELGVRLGAVLWRWLEGHEECLEQAAGVDEFSLVTSIPSTSGRQDHPLPSMLREIVKPVSDRYVDLLIPNPEYEPDAREASDDRFRVRRRLRGNSILVIDDQWTSGGRAQSAASALRLAGSSRVAIAVLGRHFDRRPMRDDYREAAERYYQAARSQRWTWSTCCLCE